MTFSIKIKSCATDVAVALCGGFEQLVIELLLHIALSGNKRSAWTPQRKLASLPFSLPPLPEPESPTVP